MSKGVEVVKAARLVRMLPLRCAIAFATTQRALSSQRSSRSARPVRAPCETHPHDFRDKGTPSAVENALSALV